MGENRKNIFNFWINWRRKCKKDKILKQKKIFSIYDIKTNKDIIFTTFHPETNSNHSYKNQIKIFCPLKKIKTILFYFHCK